jgi:hypothetical protein
MSDLVIYETGNGGDIQLSGNDLELSDGLYSRVYLAWFGGNPEAATTGDEPEGEQKLDWWGNSLLFPSNPNNQYNSRLEQALKNTELNSAGRLSIQEVAKKDVEFLNELGDVTVEVSIVGINHVKIVLAINEPTNQQNKEFQFIWDATREEVIVDIPAGEPQIPKTVPFNWELIDEVGSPAAIVITPNEVTCQWVDFFSQNTIADLQRVVEPLMVYRFTAVVTATSLGVATLKIGSITTGQAVYGLLINTNDTLISVQIITNAEPYTDFYIALNGNGIGSGSDITTYKNFTFKKAAFLYNIPEVPGLGNYTLDSPSGNHTMAYDSVKKAIRISTLSATPNDMSYLSFDNVQNIITGSKYELYFIISGSNSPTTTAICSYSINPADTFGSSQFNDGTYVSRNGVATASGTVGLRIVTSNPSEIFIHGWGFAFETN